MKTKITFLITHPLFSGSAIMIIGSNSISFLNYLYHLIMGRLLGPTNYGELASIISVIGLLGVIPLSMSIVIIKYVSSAQDREEIGGIINWFQRKLIILSIITTIPLILFAPSIASFLHIDNVFLIILAILLFVISIISLIYRSALQGLLQFKKFVVTLLFENSAKLIITIILVYLGFQVLGAVSALVLSAILGVFISRYYIEDYLTIKARLSKNIKAILLYSLPVAIQSIAITSLYSTDVILVKHFFSSHDAGIYASLSTLGKIIFFGTGPIGSVMFPLVSKRHAKGENFQKIFLYSLISTITLSLILLFIYWLFPVVVIKLLYGSLYLEGSNLLVWLGIFMTLFTLSVLFITFNLSLGKTRVVILPMIAALLQAGMIWLFHYSLMTVITISIVVNALLLVSLIIYSNFERNFYYGQKSNGDKSYIKDEIDIYNSSGV